jgi:hypothetical protein
MAVASGRRINPVATTYHGHSNRVNEKVFPINHENGRDSQHVDSLACQIINPHTFHRVKVGD